MKLRLLLGFIGLCLILFFFLPSCGESTYDAYFKKAASYEGRGFNEDTVFYADLSRPSGSYRFFVLSLKQKKVLSKGLVLNGREDERGRALYSNKPGSNCSSRGAYRVGSAYTGRFGRAFKLHGLEPTNSNAFARAVVLHQYPTVPPFPVGFSLFNSQGCPTVSPLFLKELSAYIKGSRKPILLYIQ